MRVLLRYGANHRLDDGAAYKLALEAANNETIEALLIQAETAMRAKERELERILQQQGPMWLAQQTWYPSHHARTFSEPQNLQQYHHVSAASLASLATTLATSPLMVTGNGGVFIPHQPPPGVSGTAGVGGVMGGGGGGVGHEFLSRGHKRYYSQMLNPLSVADLFRSGSVCGLVALDDEIRARQRSESNRL